MSNTFQAKLDAGVKHLMSLRRPWMRSVKCWGCGVVDSYMVTDKVWQGEAGLHPWAFLCRRRLEVRLGRPLKIEDFTPCENNGVILWENDPHALEPDRPRRRVARGGLQSRDRRP